MTYTQEDIYNLALSALLLAREVTDVDTDRSNEVRVLNLHWDLALQSTLKDLDLDHLAETVVLELIEEIDDDNIPWGFAYKYPDNCAHLRRIISGAVVDNSRTHISKQVRQYDGQKAILTDEYDASAEIIKSDVELQFLSPMAGLALAYKLAYLSAPLVVGKGAANLRKEIQMAYLVAKGEAQEDDAAENFNYESDDIRSEFVSARTE